MPTDIVDAVRTLRRSLARAAAAAFRDTGVGPKQFAVLHELRRVGSAPQVRLARATGSDPAAMMRAIDALERRGWVLRSSAGDDRRCKLVSLTPDGHRALGKLDVTYEALRSLANGALSSAERKQFCAMAAKLSASLESAGLAAPAQHQP